MLKLRIGDTPSILVVAVLLICPQQVLAAISSRDSIVVQGQLRTFVAYAPDDRAGAAKLPIVIVLHGGLGSGRRVAAQSQLMNYVDRDKFVAVFPDGQDGHWNDGRSTTASGPDDVAFLRQLISAIAEKSAGDPSRVFIAGISNGGMMAQRMACEAADAVTAIGAVAANMPTDLIERCRPSRPVPVVLFNGTADQIMPWPGGSIKRSKTLNTPGGDVLSATGTFDFWLRLDGCSESTIETLPGTHVSRYISKGCPSPAHVSLYAIENGGHNWPGSTPQNGFESAIAGYVTTEISASVLLIQFFRNYGL